MASWDFIVDVESNRLVSSFTSTRSVRPENAIYGDKPDVTVRFVEANATNADLPWRDLTTSGYSARIGIGSPGGDPTAGTFTLTFGGDTTTALDFDSTAAEIDTALNALTAITTAGGVTVTTIGAGFQIEFDAVGAQSLITSDTSALYPASSATIWETQTGDGSTKEIQVFVLETNNAAYSDLTSTISAPSSNVTVAREGVTDTTSELVRVELTGDPYQGTFSITVDGEKTDAINIQTGTLASIATAVDNLAGIGSGNTTVTGDLTNFTLQFNKSLGNIGTVTVDTANLTGAAGFTGSLDLNTTEMLQLLDGSASKQATLEIVRYDTGNSTSNTVLQESITVNQDVIPDTPPSTSGAPTYAAASHTHVEADITDLGATVTLNADADVSGNTWVLDEDTLASDSSTKLATQQSIKAYVDTQISGLGNVMEFKGAYDANTTDPTDGDIGDTYVVTVAGTGVASFWSTALEIGDIIIQENDPATTEADWVVVSRDFNGDPLINVVEDTSPQLGGMLDVNGNAIGDGTLELVKFTETGSAVNEITIANAATAGDPTISATGDDANIGLSLQGKGTGDITLGNYVFDGDGAATASEDNYVMTYDDASGTVRLEAAAGGSPEGTAVLSTGEVGGTKFLREDGDGTCSWQAVPSGTPEGTAILSTGEVGGTKFLREDGDGTCSWQTVAGGGDVTKVGTPVNNQIGVWTGDGTLEGDADLTWDESKLNVQGTGTMRLYLEKTTGSHMGLVSGTNNSLVFDDGADLYIYPTTDMTTLAGSADPSIFIEGATRNVGIANDTPTEALDVTGNIKVTGTVDGRDVAADGALAASALQDLVDDTTPTLGGPLDCGANSIGFTAQSATGDGTTTITWDNGNVFNFTFGAFNETFTFTAPTKPGDFIIKLVQDGVGSRTATWPATVKWPGGTAPTLSTAAGAIDLIRFYFDGTNYYGTFDLNFS